MTAFNTYWQGNTVAKSDPAQEALLATIAPAIYSYHTSYGEDVIASDKSQQLFMAYNGIGLRRTETFNGNKISIISKADTAPGLFSIVPGIEVEIVNKIPYFILRDLIANFKAIYDRDRTESAAQVYYDAETDTYFPYYPVQVNSSANTNYAGDQNAAIILRQRYTLVLEAHSHAGFGAFFSGGDDANEKAPLMYCVVGSFSTSRLTFAGRIKLMEHQKLLSFDEIFHIPEDVVDPLSIEDLPAASQQMLTNAGKGTAVLTAAQLAEQNAKLGIKATVVPRTTTINYGAAGTHVQANYGRHYSGEYGFYGDYYDGMYDPAAEEDYIANRKAAYDIKNKGKGKHNRNIKFNAEWLAENLDDVTAGKLLYLLEERIDGGKKI